MKQNSVLLISMLLIISIFLTGCAGMTATQKGAAGGGAVGAIAGQIIGGNTTSTLIGAGVGALGGALLNDALEDKNK